MTSLLSSSDIVNRARRRLVGPSGTLWKSQAAGSWPYRIVLGVPIGPRLDLSGEELLSWANSIVKFCDAHGLPFETRRLRSGVTITLPVSVTIPDEMSCARVAGAEEELRRRDVRLERLLSCGVDMDLAMEINRELRSRDDRCFESLVSMGVWARGHETKGMTPRQLPIPGIQGKALDRLSDQRIVCRIAGKDSLGLTTRPHLLSLKHLDPGSPCRFGQALVGTGSPVDEGRPAYETSVAIVVENRDTFVDFPLMKGAVCILGDGKAVIPVLEQLAWLGEVPKVLYWGDMDLDGLAILASLRVRGVSCESILMDLATFERFQSFGTDRDRRGELIRVDRYPKTIEGLERRELELYEAIRSERPRYPRVEQERIPYAAALDAIRSISPESQTMPN